MRASRLVLIHWHKSDADSWHVLCPCLKATSWHQGALIRGKARATHSKLGLQALTIDLSYPLKRSATRLARHCSMYLSTSRERTDKRVSAKCMASPSMGRASWASCCRLVIRPTTLRKASCSFEQPVSVKRSDFWVSPPTPVSYAMGCSDFEKQSQ